MVSDVQHPTRVTVLISASGTNLQAIIDATQRPGSTISHCRVVRVISNKKAAYGLKRAAASNPPIPTTVHNLISGGYLASGEKDPDTIRSGREAYDAELARIVLADAPDIVVCAGFMHVVSHAFLRPLDLAFVPIINLHPALPGRYDGIGAIERAWNDAQRGTLQDGETGVMVHYVIEEVDSGEPIMVRRVGVGKEESLESLTQKIHEVEHELLVEATSEAVSRLWKERASRQDHARIKQ
jgi:phosphoribosylglycinamide formyltransferase